MIRVTSGYDVNKLRELLAAGLIRDEDIAGGSFGPSAPAQQNALARILSEQEQFAAGDQSGALPMGSMRNEETGRVTYFKPGGGGFSDRPYPAQGQIPEQAKRPKVRLVGMGNDGSQTDLGEEEARAMPVDYTRPGIDLPGLGKGRYTADGRYAVVNNPDGSQTKVVLGYDAAASERRNIADLKRRRLEAGLAQTEEQTNMLRDRRMMLAQAPQKTRTDASGAPAGQAAAGGGKMTEHQAKALGFGMRLAEANEILDSVGKDGAVQPNLLKRAAEAVPLIGDGLGVLANVVPDALGGPSDAQQQVEQAQRNFINAVLRRESGAVISEEEFANARQQYFPQPGDSPDVISQKKRNRELVQQAFAEESGDRRPLIEKTAQDAKAKYQRIETDALPDPRQYAGKTMTDTKTGLRYKSTGTNWVRQ